MVTANSLTQDLGFKVRELLSSGLHEDGSVAELATKTVKQIVEKIKPILHYICVLVNAKDAQIYLIKVVVGKYRDVDKLSLALTRDGHWGVLNEETTPVNFFEEADAWTYVPFGELVNGLQEALKLAEDKRAEHLQAVSKRSELLANIRKVIAGEAVPAAETK